MVRLYHHKMGRSDILLLQNMLKYLKVVYEFIDISKLDETNKENFSPLDLKYDIVCIFTKAKSKTAFEENFEKLFGFSPQELQDTRERVMLISRPQNTLSQDDILEIFKQLSILQEKTFDTEILNKFEDADIKKLVEYIINKDKNGKTYHVYKDDNLLVEIRPNDKPYSLLKPSITYSDFIMAILIKWMFGLSSIEIKSD